MSEASLVNTYWRLLRVGADEVPRGTLQSEPHLLFREAEGRAVGTGGCNRFSGGYSLDGDRLAFSPIMATRMACPPPADTVESSLFSALEATVGWRISGQLLELLDSGGESIAVFEAVYLP